MSNGLASQAAGVGWKDCRGGELVHQIDEHLLFGGPASVEGRLANARARGHLVHRQALVTAVCEFGEERGNDCLRLFRSEDRGAGWLAGRLGTGHGTRV